MTDLQDAGDQEEAAYAHAHEEGNDMSPRAKDAGQRQTKIETPRRPNVSLIAGIAGAVAVAVIIVYALLHANRAVPGAAVATDAPMPARLQAGVQAPAFKLRGAIGSFSSSELAGKPYLLEIFATWCPHCQRMTAVLRAIRARVPESRFAMVSVTGSPYGASSTPDNIVPSSQQDVDTFDTTYGVTWPSLYDPDLAVAHAWGLNGFPTIFVVNAKGTIVYSSDGEVSQATLMDAIRKAGA
jgi:thiol-disulfide isomerase/thioredoxin